MKLSKLVLLGCCMISVISYGRQPKGIQLNNNEISDTATCGLSCNCDRSQTPLGIMTNHIHPKGTWMASYTFMNMTMQGNRMGSSVASDAIVYKNYAMTPETMNMQMHMVMLMHGLTDRLTLMAMGGYVTGNMSMTMNADMPGMPGMTNGNLNMLSFTSGFADTKLYGLYNFSNNGANSFIASLGINLPTGTIRATGTTTLGDNHRLPYNMQPGTGSFCLLPDITLIHKAGLFSIGAKTGADIKLNTNELGYKQGNNYHLSVWGAYQFLPWLSGSLRGETVFTDKLRGKDIQVTMPVTEQNDPTVVTVNYGGTVVNIYTGINIHFAKPILERFGILAEFGLPVYQNLNGTQMSLLNNFYASILYSL